MEGLGKFCLTAFDITSIVGQQRIILVTKNLLCTNIPRFHLLIFVFLLYFLLLFSNYLPSPFSTVPKMCAARVPNPPGGSLSVDPCAWMDPEGSQPCPAVELCICVLQCRNPSHTRQSLFCQPKDVSSLVPQKPCECSFDPVKILIVVNLL